MSAVLVAAVGWFVLDRESAIENAVSAIVVGLAAGAIYQLSAYAYRFVWTVPLKMYEEDRKAITRLESERDALIERTKPKFEIVFEPMEREGDSRPYLQIIEVPKQIMRGGAVAQRRLERR
ncbi:MAG TPA: hypothetical protein VMO26_25040, partial [Vicinamibacterales bacterium]|nr:hypothetical protein [Vicinamibacterales bacterium]